jgi:predicted Zn-dependent protease
MRLSKPSVRPTALALAALLFAASCVSTNLPPVAGAAFEPTRDELALWQEARVEEETLLAEIAVYDDPLLVDYLEGIVAELTPPAMAANRHLSYRVTVVEDPTLNAFAYPHGALFVHSGLLARMENEAQLATVLGHEMSHVEYRHMLRQRRSAQNQQVALAAASVAAAVVLADAQADAWYDGDWGEAAVIGVFGEAILSLGLQLAFVAAVNGYGRELELEADGGGFRKLSAAGYDVAQAPRVYEILLDGAGGEAGRVETFFFGSHPRLTERIASADRFVAARGEVPEVTEEEAVPVAVNGLAHVEAEAAPGSDRGDEEFRRRLRPVVRDDARMNLEAGRLEHAEASLAKALDWMPDDPESHLLLARLRLAQAEQDAEQAPQLESQARDALHEAIRLDTERPEPHHELALLHYRAGELADACREFRFFLETAPDDERVGPVEDHVLELEERGAC